MDLVSALALSSAFACPAGISERAVGIKCDVAPVVRIMIGKGDFCFCLGEGIVDQDDQ